MLWILVFVFGAAVEVTIVWNLVWLLDGRPSYMAFPPFMKRFAKR